MSLFDRLKSTGTATPAWMKELEAEWSVCDRATPSSKRGTSLDIVGRIVLPLLSDNLEPLKTNYGAMLGGFRMAIVVPGTAAQLGVSWCTACAHPTMLISNPSTRIVQECSNCKRKLDTNFIDYSREIGKFVRSLFEKQAAGIALMSRGEQLLDQNQAEAALKVFEQARTGAREIGVARCEAKALVAMGSAADDLGRKDEARAHRDQAQRLYESIGDHDGVAECIEGRANEALGAFELGLCVTLCERAEDICGRDGGVIAGPVDAVRVSHLAGVVGLKAMAYAFNLNRRAEALAVAEEARQIRLTANKWLVTKCGQGFAAEIVDGAVNSVRKILASAGDPAVLDRAMQAAAKGGDDESALQALETVENAARALGDKRAVLWSLNAQLPALTKHRGLDGLFNGCRKIEAVARQLDDVNAISASLANQAEILGVLENKDAAAKRAEADAAKKTAANAAKEAQQLETKVAAAEARKDWPAVCDLARAQWALLRRLNQNVAIAPVLGRLYQAEANRGDKFAAMQAMESLEALGRDTHNLLLVSFAQAKQGAMLEEASDWIGAIGRYRRSVNSSAEGVARLPDDGSQESKTLAEQMQHQARETMAGLRRIGKQRAATGDAALALVALRGAVEGGQGMVNGGSVDAAFGLDHVAALDELGVLLLKGDRLAREEGTAVLKRAIERLNDIDSNDAADRASRDALRRDLQAHLGA